ncbi:hypothetical protein IC582_004279 [Cucumis melo]
MVQLTWDAPSDRLPRFFRLSFSFTLSSLLLHPLLYTHFAFDSSLNSPPKHSPRRIFLL